MTNEIFVIFSAIMLVVVLFFQTLIFKHVKPEKYDLGPACVNNMNFDALFANADDKGDQGFSFTSFPSNKKYILIYRGKEK